MSYPLNAVMVFSIIGVLLTGLQIGLSDHDRNDGPVMSLIPYLAIIAVNVMYILRFE